jgi:hypothetical protein
VARIASPEDSQSTATTCRLDVHGLRLAVHGEWPEVIQAVALDFAWFAADPESPADVTVEVERRAPDFDALGEQRASFITPRNVVYGSDERTVVDYFGRAVCIVSGGGDRALAQGEDLHLVHEAVYLFLLSRVGEHLDRVGLPRLHALGLAGSQGGVAVMLPSGGGKSTLALRAIRDERVRVLSEDTPLIDRHGRMHPFPLRIGVNATDAASMPGDHVRRIERMEFHPKLVLDLEAFADHIETEPQPLRHLVIGVRSLGTQARLEPLRRRAAVAPLFREAVVGVGVYQGMEFVLQRGLRDVLGKTGTAAIRARCCAAGLARAKVWELTLGRDHDANWRALSPLLSG